MRNRLRGETGTAGIGWLYLFFAFLEIKKINDKVYEKYDMIVAEVSLT